MASNNLSKVEVFVSTICADESGNKAWSYLRDFGRWGDFLQVFEDRPVKSSLLMGDQERLVGCRRVLCIGHGKLVEQLVAFDEDRQSLTYKLITHPANVNPFTSAFVNYSCRLRVRQSTMTSQSLVEMHVSFLTDAGAAQAMHSKLSSLHEGLLHGLSRCLSRAAAFESAGSQPLPSLRSSGSLSLKPVGSVDVFAASSPTYHQPMSMNDFMGQMARRQDSTDSSRLRLDGQLGLSGQ